MQQPDQSQVLGRCLRRAQHRRTRKYTGDLELLLDHINIYYNDSLRYNVASSWIWILVPWTTSDLVPTARSSTLKTLCLDRVVLGITTAKDVNVFSLYLSLSLAIQGGHFKFETSLHFLLSQSKTLILFTPFTSSVRRGTKSSGIMLQQDGRGLRNHVDHSDGKLLNMSKQASLTRSARANFPSKPLPLAQAATGYQFAAQPAKPVTKLALKPLTPVSSYAQK
ncbi:hypothetical protein M8C21_011835 [Ambrosia artemisiifolia]|uniref:Uncharacterized protein n=1 Tax=Ambrosia artemisiifolia TaxID=4212 RepID=A0AAD5DC17_AMBAR|nr:hypothetical protein M8C21_011835 [Ambrosia artemisiifolia]